MITTPSLSAAEQLLYSVHRLRFEGNEGEWESSGFTYKVPLDDGLQSDVIITCKHCVEDAKFVVWRVRRGAGVDPIRQPKFAEIRIPLYREFLVEHPTEDIAAILVRPFTVKIEREDGVSLVSFAFGEQHIPSDEECDAAMPIVMPGAPIGQYDDANNHVIFRTGLTASHPGFGYKHTNTFLVDIAAHEGSSGSPILSWSPYSFDRATGKYDLHFEPQIKLLGMLRSGLEFESGDDGHSGQHAHLGVAIRANILRELVCKVTERIHEVRTRTGPLTSPAPSADQWTIAYSN